MLGIGPGLHPRLDLGYGFDRVVFIIAVSEGIKSLVSLGLNEELSCCLFPLLCPREIEDPEKHVVEPH